jgi:hypothetical protein
VLNDGTRYRYSRDEVPIELFKHASACMHADFEGQPRPAPPEILQAVAWATDRRAAIGVLYPEWPTKQPLCAYDLMVLVETGELIAKPFAPGYPPITEEA